MAGKTGIVWIIPPTHLQREVTKYGDRVMAAINFLADFFAQKMQNEARQNAKWEDRTGNARSGLMGATRKAARDIVEIYLVHSMWYGKFLELARGGKYAVIMPTISANVPEISSALKRLLR